MNRRQFNFALGTTTAAVALKWPLAMPRGADTLRVNGARLNQHLKELSEFGKNPQGGVSRVAYSEADRLGREYVMGLMRSAKLNVSIDAGGNIIGGRRMMTTTRQKVYEKTFPLHQGGFVSVVREVNGTALVDLPGMSEPWICRGRWWLELEIISTGMDKIVLRAYRITREESDGTEVSDQL